MKCLIQTSSFSTLYWNHLSNGNLTEILPGMDFITDFSQCRLVLMWELSMTLFFSLAASQAP